MKFERAILSLLRCATWFTIEFGQPHKLVIIAIGRKGGHNRERHQNRIPLQSAKPMKLHRY
jgi:hypothetical protein